MHVVTTHQWTPGPVRSMAQEQICRRRKPHSLCTHKGGLRFYRQRWDSGAERIKNMESPKGNGQMRKVLLPGRRQRNRRCCLVGQVCRSQSRVQLYRRDTHGDRQEHGYPKDNGHIRMAHVPTEDDRRTARRIELSKQQLNTKAWDPHRVGYEEPQIAVI